MAKCGIKKFDDMPSVYAGIDVDAGRAELNSLLRKTAKVIRRLNEASHGYYGNKVGQNGKKI